jgi:hypothetical protein
MYTPHYPQRICLTSIYSYDEYNIFNIMLFVMTNNTRRMRVCQGILSFLLLTIRLFFRNFLRLQRNR